VVLRDRYWWRPLREYGLGVDAMLDTAFCPYSVLTARLDGSLARTIGMQSGDPPWLATVVVHHHCVALTVFLTSCDAKHSRSDITSVNPRGGDRDCPTASSESSEGSVVGWTQQILQRHDDNVAMPPTLWETSRVEQQDIRVRRTRHR